MRKQKPNARIRTPVEQLGTDDTIQHYNAVLIEDMRSTVDTALEGVYARLDVLDDKITAFDTKLESFRKDVEIQFEILGAEVRRNTQTINELRGVTHQLIETVDSHEERVERIEKIS